MRLLGYIRVSTDDQADHGHSLRTVQPARLQAYAALHGHQLVGTFTDEGVSASVPLHKRKGGKALLAALQAGEGEGVVVVRLDRLFRSALDGLRFFEDMEGVAVHSVSELIDTSTPAGRLGLTLMLGAAQYERDLAVQRAQDNSRGLRRAGRVYGHVPYGCTSRDGLLMRDPLTWPSREYIVNLRDQGYSLGTIRAMLRDEGIHAPDGGDMWSKSVLNALCKLHPELTHLPEAPLDDAAVPASALDTEVSHVH